MNALTEMGAILCLSFAGVLSLGLMASALNQGRRSAAVFAVFGVVDFALLAQLIQSWGAK